MNTFDSFDQIVGNTVLFNTGDGIHEIDFFTVNHFVSGNVAEWNGE